MQKRINNINDVFDECEADDIPTFSHSTFTKLYDLNIEEILKEIKDQTRFISRNVSLKRIGIKNLRCDSLKLQDEIFIHLENENDFITAICYDLGQYGQGVSEEEAIQDLCETIAEYYYLLVSEKKDLSKPLRGHLEYLEMIIKEI